MPERDQGSRNPGARQSGSEQPRVDETLEHAERTGTQGRQDASQKATEFTRDAKQRAEEGKSRAAGTMEDAAQELRERAEGTGGVQAKAGEKVAEGMEKTAGYLREKDTQQVMDDVERYVREHPVQAIAGAIFGGFVIARILR